MKERLLLLNTYLHDLATGTWLGILLILWRVRARMAAMGLIGSRVASIAVKPALQDVFWWGVLALVIILATGALRLWGEQKWGIGIEIPINRGVGRELWCRQRGRMLLVKHVFLLLVFGIGTCLQYRLAWVF